jgi:hypothetical protein
MGLEVEEYTSLNWVGTAELHFQTSILDAFRSPLRCWSFGESKLGTAANSGITRGTCLHYWELSTK